MAKFLTDINKKKNGYIENGKDGFEKGEIKEYMEKFETILKVWKSEWMQSTDENNQVYEDERKLLSRFEDEKKKNEIMYFLKDKRF